MRPMKPADAIRAIQITTRFPAVHGAPVHIGKPELIGIADLAKPDYGDLGSVNDDEIPVFWACGVTPAIGSGDGEAEFITHRQHAGDRPAQHRVRVRWAVRSTKQPHPFGSASEPHTHLEAGFGCGVAREHQGVVTGHDVRRRRASRPSRS